MSESCQRLKDKVIIITGGGRGLGRAFALGMADEGAKLVIAGRTVSALEATLTEILEKTQDALTVQVDVTKVEDTESMVSSTIDRFGRIDILINNAAMLERPAISRKPFWELEIDEWDRVMEVNLKGTFLCSRAVFPYMKSQKSGKIINMSSGTYMQGVPFQSHYVASKGGVIGLTRSWAREVGEFGIGVNCIAPGGTQAYDINNPDEKEGWERRQASLEKASVSNRCFKRIEYAEDLVGTAIFLASSESDFITGQTIVVDGGSNFI
jgi:3-oxoacyl-[acyl-carrier protein] reductase